MDNEMKTGRYAPSPSGRMHLGNVFTALVSWLSVRSAGGKWILRIEDLDPQRSRYEYARKIEDDLAWLGLDWDEGGLDDRGDKGPYSQSRRHDIYLSYLRLLADKRLLYPCTCRRADILATQAPHQSDGRIIYAGTCRPSARPPFPPAATDGSTLRLYVPDEVIRFTDIVYGPQESNLRTDCGDFIVRRADGAWAYQLAVVVDDGLMGVTEVVRGNDLLLSTAQQLYLYDLLGLPAPQFAHLPLICSADGRRLSKRDRSASMEELRKKSSPEEIIGQLARIAGILPHEEPCRAEDLIPLFSWDKIPGEEKIIIPQKQ